MINHLAEGAKGIAFAAMDKGQQSRLTRNLTKFPRWFSLILNAARQGFGGGISVETCGEHRQHWNTGAAKEVSGVSRTKQDWRHQILIGITMYL
jgi:hypothetical protein